MHLTASVNQIVGSLLVKDTFSSEDFATLKVPDELVEHRDGIARAALGLLTDSGMVRPIGPDLWMLTAPLNSAGQDVHLSMAICNEIAAVINDDLESKEIEDRVDALNVHEGHIAALLSILHETLADEPPEE